MRLVGLILIQEFAKRHADVKPQVESWVSEAQSATWRSPADVKARFPTASFLRDNRVIFNLKGNKYRLDTKISYETQILLVKRVGTHAEYSKWEF
ncbi:MAG: type II toxin-antitoxin system HigB family toxin [Bacteroidota bacterium]